MAELVDAYGSGPYEKIFHAGSNPVIRTILSSYKGHGTFLLTTL